VCLLADHGFEALATSAAYTFLCKELQQPAPPVVFTMARHVQIITILGRANG
jgi:hypothetical protein